MAFTGFNWDMVDANSNDAPTTPLSDAFTFDPSAMLSSSELSAQLEMLAAEFVFMAHLDSADPIAFMFDNNDMVDVGASAYDSDSTASTATTRSAASSAAAAPATAAAAGGFFSREERRKTKQRCYEKNYRGRVREKRARKEETWIQLEREFRDFLLKHASIVPRQSDGDDNVPNFELCVFTGTNFPGFTSTPSETMNALRRQYVELQNEEIALRYHAAYYKSLLAWTKALNFWGGQTDANRRIREQINALPSLQLPHAFEFQW